MMGNACAGRVAVIASSTLLLLAMAGCGGGAPPPAAAPGPAAQVGSDVIPAALFQLRLQSTLAAIDQGGGPAHGTAGYSTMLRSVRASVMRGLIVDAVIAQEAAFRSLAATDAQVQSEVDGDARAAGGTDRLAQKLAQAGGSVAQLRDEIRSRLNEQRLEDLFAQQRAADVESRLAGGADFAALARDLSDDSGTRDKGGLLGDLSADQLRAADPAFAAAVERLAPMQTTQAAVRDDAGYDVVRVDAVTGATRTVRHILVAAPRVYRVQDRPAWFTESIVGAIAQECAQGAVHVYIDAGVQPCSTAGAGRASPATSRSSAAAPSP